MKECESCKLKDERIKVLDLSLTTTHKQLTKETKKSYALRERLDAALYAMVLMQHLIRDEADKDIEERGYEYKDGSWITVKKTIAINDKVSLAT